MAVRRTDESGKFQKNLQKSVAKRIILMILISSLLFLETDVPIALDMEALKREEPDEEELRRLFEMLEFRSLIDQANYGQRYSYSP